MESSHDPIKSKSLNPEIVNDPAELQTLLWCGRKIQTEEQTGLSHIYLIDSSLMQLL